MALNIPCRQCVLHSGIPGVVINSEGLCTACAESKERAKMDRISSQLFTNKLKDQIAAAKKRKRPFQALVLFSGGKDSAHLLKIVKEEYQLKTLACSIVHPLVNKTASGNMEEVAGKLGVDLLKLYPEERVYKKVMRQGLLHVEKYGLDEFAGCSVCSFLFKWLSFKMALQLDIPLIFDGSDISQSDGPYYLDGKTMARGLSEGARPFGALHQVVADALGPEYEGSLYDCNPDDLKNRELPSIIAPFTFMPYDYRENFREIERMGVESKKFRKLFTNCNAIPFFSYFSLKRYDCVPYIKHYASEIRRGYSNLLQLKLDSGGHENALTRETVSRMMEEYKKIIFYVADHKLDLDRITPEQRRRVAELAPTYLRVFEPEVCEVLFNDVLMINHYARVFEMELE
ncbi:MAG: hypothetical protein K6U80_04745 [Firmicutes bacterium]|nr:hypothetical protein [Bacillota bacterium]